MDATLIEWLYLSLPLLISLTALAAAVSLFLRARRAVNPTRRRAWAGALLAVVGMSLASMGAPCAYQSLGHHDDLDFCAPRIVLMFNPYVSLGWLFHRQGS